MCGRDLWWVWWNVWGGGKASVDHISPAWPHTKPPCCPLLLFLSARLCGSLPGPLGVCPGGLATPAEDTQHERGGAGGGDRGSGRQGIERQQGRAGVRLWVSMWGRGGCEYASGQCLCSAGGTRLFHSAFTQLHMPDRLPPYTLACAADAAGDPRDLLLTLYSP